MTAGAVRQGENLMRVPSSPRLNPPFDGGRTAPLALHTLACHDVCFTHRIASRNSSSFSFWPLLLLAHHIASMNTAPFVAYLVAGFLVLGILLSALSLWLLG
jgi:hypothetical protein